jgi:hypothetical protein
MNDSETAADEQLDQEKPRTGKKRKFPSQTNIMRKNRADNN